MVNILAEECFELGRHAYRNEDFYHTILWMDEALTRSEDEVYAKSISKATILDYLSYSMSMVCIFVIGDRVCVSLGSLGYAPLG